MKLYSQAAEWAHLNRTLGLDPKFLHGCMIGGSSVWSIQERKAIPNAFAHDIDIFVRRPEDFDGARKVLKLADYEKIEDKSTHKVFKFTPQRRGLQRPSIHLILHDGAAAPASLLSRFDFTFCAAVINIDDKTCYHHTAWIADNEGHLLDLVRPYLGYASGTRRRVEKFLDRGYMIFDEDNFWSTLEGRENCQVAEREDQARTRDRRDHGDRDSVKGGDDTGDGPEYRF